MNWILVIALSAVGAYFWRKEKAVNMPLDKQLPADKRVLAQLAINNGSDSKVLRALAETYLPEFPLTAAALRKKASELS